MSSRLVLSACLYKQDIAIITSGYFMHKIIIEKIMRHHIFKSVDHLKAQPITASRIEISNGSRIYMYAEAHLNELRGISWDAILCQDEGIKYKVEQQFAQAVKPGGEIALFRVESNE